MQAQILSRLRSALFVLAGGRNSESDNVQWTHGSCRAADVWCLFCLPNTKQNSHIYSPGFGYFKILTHPSHRSWPQLATAGHSWPPSPQPPQLATVTTATAAGHHHHRHRSWPQLAPVTTAITAHENGHRHNCRWPSSHSVLVSTLWLISSRIGIGSCVHYASHGQHRTIVLRYADLATRERSRRHRHPLCPNNADNCI